ncbi:uncharacterized protein LTHEOB_759 [Neofusicoccum parvum]|nr:uncharacterized protein LTHEOB_759 [Neofusicoccum parvum]
MVAAFSYTVIQDKGYDFVAAPIRTGDCGKIERMGSVIHLAINAASTLLLGASNYSMQVLSAPTRKDIDEAHRRGSWLDIGVLSIRNFASIRGKKLWLWLALGFSSVPLHLVYNSTFFVSTANHNYDIYIANDQFATGAEFDDFIGKYDDTSVYANYTPFPLSSGSNPHTVQRSLVDLTQGKESDFERLENDECMRSYAKTILSDRRNLILYLLQGFLWRTYPYIGTWPGQLCF